MKSKLRKIVIENQEYLYTVSNIYNLEIEKNLLTVKVFLRGQKQTPLIIEFLTIDHYYMGQLLNSGVVLQNNITNTEAKVNINEPKYLKNLILQGKKNGWTGINKLDTQDGLLYLKEMGYETDILIFK